MPSIGGLRYQFNRLKARIGVLLLRRASKKEKGVIDRLFGRILAWVTNTSRPAENDFMQDELVDSDIEFDPTDLDTYQKQPQQPKKKKRSLTTSINALRSSMFVEKYRVYLFITVISLFSGSEANAKPPKVPTAHVNGKVFIPKSLESFENLTLEIRLYKFNPLIADKAADLVEKKRWMKINHKKGSQSAIDFDLGQKATLDTRMHYYLTIFLLDGKKRTHIGEIDGKRGLNKVITNGKSKNLKIMLRAVR